MAILDFGGNKMVLRCGMQWQRYQEDLFLPRGYHQYIRGYSLHSVPGAQLWGTGGCWSLQTLGIRNQTQFVIIVNTEYKPQAPENVQAEVNPDFRRIYKLAIGQPGLPVHTSDHH